MYCDALAVTVHPRSYECTELGTLVPYLLDALATTLKAHALACPRSYELQEFLTLTSIHDRPRILREVTVLVAPTLWSVVT